MYEIKGFSSKAHHRYFEIITLFSNQHTSTVIIFAIYFLLKVLQHFFSR